VLARGARSPLPTLQFGGGRVVLRLFDDLEHRSAPDFEESWRALLRAWNLMQFTSLEVSVTTSERIVEAGGEPEAATPQVAEAGPADGAEADFARAMPEVHELLRGVRAAGLPMPIVGFELMDDRGRIVAEAELAWLQAKVAVVLQGRDADRDVLRTHGWAVLGSDARVEEVAAALGERAEG